MRIRAKKRGISTGCSEAELAYWLRVLIIRIDKSRRRGKSGHWRQSLGDIPKRAVLADVHIGRSRVAPPFCRVCEQHSGVFVSVSRIVQHSEERMEKRDQGVKARTSKEGQFKHLGTKVLWGNCEFGTIFVTALTTTRRAWRVGGKRAQLGGRTYLCMCTSGFLLMCAPYEARRGAQNRGILFEESDQKSVNTPAERQASQRGGVHRAQAMVEICLMGLRRPLK